MRKMLTVIVLAALAWSCDGVIETSNVTCEKMFQGEHPLMCATFDSSSAECAYASVSWSSVKFMWQTFDTSYAVSVVPIDKFRVKIDEYADAPYVKYRWTSCRCASDLKSIMETNVMYVVMVCRSEYCPRELRDAHVNVERNKLDLAKRCPACFARMFVTVEERGAMRIAFNSQYGATTEYGK